MSDRPNKRVERHYAHFHRVLSELLTDLSQEAGTTWLFEQGHTFAEAYQDNIYRKAVYPISDLTPYAPRLAELAQVQQEALAQLGAKKVPHGLLTPQVLEQVTYARLRRKLNYNVRRGSKAEILGRYQQKLNNALAAQQAFRAQARGGADEGLERIEAEVLALQKGIANIEAANDETFREHYTFARVPVSVYRTGMPMKQYHVRDVGLVLVGPSVRVGWNDGVRMQRSDTTQLEPLLSLGPLEVFSSRDWLREYQAVREGRAAGTDHDGPNVA